MAGQLKLAKTGRKQVLYYSDEGCWDWSEFHWWNPFHWFKRKRRTR